MSRFLLFVKEPYYRLGFSRIEVFNSFDKMLEARVGLIQYVGNKSRGMPGTKTWTEAELKRDKTTIAKSK